MGALIVIDTETTSQYPDRALILEVGAVAVENGRITNKFTSMVHRRDDELVGAEQAMAFNRITREEVQDAPEAMFVRELLHDFIRLNQGEALTSFNIEYDRTVLYGNGWLVIGVPWSECIMLAAHSIMQQAGVLSWNPKYRRYSWPSMAAAATFFDIENPRAHRALGDALTAAFIWLEILRRRSGVRPPLPNP